VPVFRDEIDVKKLARAAMQLAIYQAQQEQEARKGELNVVK
jgi:hypothetical protein